MNARPHNSTTVLGLEADGHTLRLTLGDGSVFVATNATELWQDAWSILQDRGVVRPALTGNVREVLEPELVDDDAAADEFSHHDDEEIRLDPESLQQYAAKAGDVFEEVAAQEYGALGRAAAKLIRRNGQNIHDAISPRARAKRIRGRRA